MTEFQEGLEVFWEKRDSISADFVERLLPHSVEEIFPGSFLFSLPGSDYEKGKKGFSFFDPSGAFTRAIVMDRADQDGLEAILETYCVLKREAEAFFKKRGSRIFQPGIETRLILFATDFQEEFIRYLRFAGVKARLVCFSLIEGQGRKGILLRWVEGEERKPHDGDQKGFLAVEEGLEKDRFFFEEVPLRLEEENALKRLPLLPRKTGPAILHPENP
jgi:hypothetical protein